MRIAVVGAGLSGLMAARMMAAAGHQVVVYDKGRGPGGRLATRRIGAATVDHGAQFFTVRSDDFAEHVQRWTADGVVFEWCRGFTPEGDGYPRYAVHGGMNALAKHLATGLDVRCNTLVFGVRPGAGATWDVQFDDGTAVVADAVLVTCPLPQTVSLLMTAEVDVPEALWRIDYDRTLALLAVLDRASAVPAPGGVQAAPGFTFIGDNARKGISAVAALTLHADPTWSAEHWNDEPAAALAELTELAAPWLGDAAVVESQLKRWRFATPKVIWPQPCWTAAGPRPLALAGDAFAGPRIEGAAASGSAAARALLEALPSGTLEP
jgi:renalase